VTTDILKAIQSAPDASKLLISPEATAQLMMEARGMYIAYTGQPPQFMSYIGREVIHEAPQFCKACGAPAEDRACSYCGTPSDFVRVGYGVRVVRPEVACEVSVR